MIYGCKFWNDGARYYTQENNPIERYLQLLGNKSWYESCGCSSAATCCEKTRPVFSVSCIGTYRPQADQIIWDYLNDPRNKHLPDLEPIARTLPGNRIGSLYPIAVWDLFSIRAETVYKVDKEVLVSALKDGCAVQCALADSYHFIAVVAWDSDTGAFIYDDSAPGLTYGKVGHNLTLDPSEFHRISTYRCNVYWPD